MDKRTVFQDGLVLARWLKVLDRGVLVAEPPNLWLFQDTNGDLRADRKELVTDDYGRREANVEHNANSLFWALDNNIYTSEIDIDLRLKNGKFDVRRTLSRGQWGITQDDAGRIFRNSNESALHVDLVPARYFMRHSNLLRTRGSYESLNGPNGELNEVWPIRPTHGVNRGYQHGILRPDGTLAKYTSVCTPIVYRGDRLPAELYGNVFVVDPTVNLVSRFILTDSDSGLTASKAYRDVRGEFLASTDERFRPVNLSLAPDGTLYVVDMYRGIIQHKGYMTEYLRDYVLTHKLEQPNSYGRIYRIVHDTTRRDTTPLSIHSTTAQLVPLLSHPNGWRRDRAQQLLVERGDKSVVPALRKLADGAADVRTRLHALWTLDALEAVEPATVIRALAHPNRDLRVSALRIAERWFGEPNHPIQGEVLKRLDDRDWAVRRQLAATLGELPAGSKESALASLLERHGDDPIAVDAAISGMRGSELAVLDRLLQAASETPQRSAAITMLSATIVQNERRCARSSLAGSCLGKHTRELATIRVASRCRSGVVRSDDAGCAGSGCGRSERAVRDMSRWSRWSRRCPRISGRTGWCDAADSAGARRWAVRHAQPRAGAHCACRRQRGACRSLGQSARANWLAGQTRRGDRLLRR